MFVAAWYVVPEDLGNVISAWISAYVRRWILKLLTVYSFILCSLEVRLSYSWKFGIKKTFSPCKRVALRKKSQLGQYLFERKKHYLWF